MIVGGVVLHSGDAVVGVKSGFKFRSRVEWSRGGLRGLRGKVSIYIYMIQVIGCACWNLYIFPFATYYLFTRIEN